MGHLCAVLRYAPLWYSEVTFENGKVAGQQTDFRDTDQSRVPPRPRHFHSFMGSLQTDLADGCPLQCAVEWLGNSETIAAAHQLKTTTNRLATAQAEGVGIGVVGISVVGIGVAGASLADTTALRGNQTQKKSEFP
jgi:hypothetical protein